MTTEATIETAFPYLESDLGRVQQRLSLEFGRYPDYPAISDMLRHLFGGVPKLVRPTLTLTAAYTVTGHDHPVSDRVVDAAALVELMHVGTLCHDDVMDEADTRRGRPSVNAVWGNCLAILAGNHLLATASEIASILGQREARIVAETFRALADGQLIETMDRDNVDRTEKSYYDAITGKTAELLACACKLGALAADGTDAQVEAFERFGRAFGVAFQINDDVLDFVLDAQRLGKPAGHDILEGVYTLPVILARATRADLRDLLAPPVHSERLPPIVAVLRESGAIESASAAAAEHLRVAAGALSDVGGADATAALTRFVSDTLNAVGIAGPAGDELYYRADVHNR